MWREVVIEQAQGVGQWGQRGSRLEAQAGSLDFTPAAVQAGSGGVGPLLRSAVAARCSTGVGLNVAVWWCDECGEEAVGYLGRDVRYRESSLSWGWGSKQPPSRLVVT